MTFAQNMLLYPDGDRGKLQRQLRRRKAVNLYCICACTNHPYPLEIFEAKELYKALKQEKEYHVVALARNKEEALSMIVGLMECLVERDPQLRRMKETIGEIYR